jgi:hypothetical protein
MFKLFFLLLFPALALAIWCDRQIQKDLTRARASRALRGYLVRNN